MLLTLATFFLSDFPDLEDVPRYDDYYGDDMSDDDEMSRLPTKEQCTAPHTRWEAAGYCACEDGYIGDPWGPDGCYRCAQECHEHASCVAPGECKCQGRYYGDGVNVCEKHVPRILSIEPSVVSSEEGGSIVVRFDYPYSRSELTSSRFCDFEGIRVGADSFDIGWQRCLAPPQRSGNRSLTISIDGDGWSEPVTLQWTSTISLWSIIPYVLLEAGVLALVAWIFYRWAKERQQQDEEKQR